MATQGTRGAANGIAVYQYLESLQLKPAAVNKNGENALHNIARKANQLDIANYFLSKGANGNQPDNDGNTPFMIAAASNRDTATVALFLSHAKNINQVNKKGQSALTMAVRSNSAEVVQFLISKAADIHVADAEGNNLAYYLIQSYSPQGGGQEGGGRGGQRGDAFTPKLKVLQDAGFNLATPQKDGNTLYHLAIMKNDLSLLKRMEPMKVDVNAKNKEGLTPLQKAAMIAKDDTILKYLLSIGAKKDIATEFKETAYDMAKENEFLSKNNIPVDFLK
jgi:ankyrin repeat protein